eukprot:TRINITY_DN50759_c0_g1_i1.p1 TRINITY_DN50759_c0_g1~~TRINITY_DN50759_c0_g1_i1.p1  ORF type:complete len:221 (-),score=30.35 TRINITY_DN50759_c0_g1_i1:46-708(-)
MGAALQYRPKMDAVAGSQALAAAKVGTAVAYKQAAYSMELAKHASYAAQEMDNTSRAMQRYILGTTVLTASDIDPTAGQLGGSPPSYSAYSYPLGSDRWPENYPVPGPLRFPETYPAQQPVSQASVGVLVEQSVLLDPPFPFRQSPPLPPRQPHSSNRGTSASPGTVKARQAVAAASVPADIFDVASSAAPGVAEPPRALSSPASWRQRRRPSNDCRDFL